MQATLEQVQARNQFNAFCNLTEGHLVRLLNDWQDQKVWKVSGHGGAVAKLKKQFDQYCQQNGYNQQGKPFLSLVGRYGALNVFIRATCYPGGEGTPINLSADIYLARFNDQTGVMTRLLECYKRRVDYTLEELKEKAERAYALEAEARELRSSISDFR
tara:strand:- start:1635 stop:2111 length:477 start_codon:yes stop_codon:yes gene_type:complete